MQQTNFELQETNFEFNNQLHITKIVFLFDQGIEYVSYSPMNISVIIIIIINYYFIKIEKSKMNLLSFSSNSSNIIKEINYAK